MATFNDPGTLNAFPGFDHIGCVAPSVREIVVQFDAKFLGAMSRAPVQYIAQADIGTYVQTGYFEGKVPMQLPGSLAFEPFVDGQTTYQQLFVAAPLVKSAPYRLAFEWPYVIQNGNALLSNFYGPQTLSQAFVDGGRVHKYRLLGDMRKVAYGVNAQALTIPQPGYPNGLPLYTDGTITASHFSHPFKANSARFNNLYLTAGKFDAAALYTTQTNMANIAHPTLPGMPAGYEVHHVKGPTWMRKPFYDVAVGTLQLQIQAGIGAAVTNTASLDKLRELGQSQFIGAAGIGPVVYHIDPTMDSHPLVAGANQGKHLWEAIDGSEMSAPYANFLAPNPNFTPTVFLFGDQSEEAKKSGKIRMIGDLHAGIGAGWPGGVALYYEG